jgi:hypothetical protein
MQIVADSSTLDTRDTSKGLMHTSHLKACLRLRVTQCALMASHVTIHGHRGLHRDVLPAQVK